jgi:Cu/Zn superoxide dismutase
MEFNMFTLYKFILVCGACVILTACAGGSTELPTSKYSSVKGGYFYLTHEGSTLYSQISGYAHLVVTDTHSSIEIGVSGLTNDVVYNSHVHTGTCATGGGGYYKQDASGAQDSHNGLWPTLKVNSRGVGSGRAEHDFIVSADAKSVVIHQPGTNSRIACADLNTSQVKSGKFVVSSLGLALYDKFSGQAFLAVNESGNSIAELNVNGLTPEETYGFGVYTQPCSINLGGERYLQDMAGPDIKENGMWSWVDVDLFAYGIGWVRNPFKVRLNEAASVVLLQAGTDEKIACANLTEKHLIFAAGILMPLKMVLHCMDQLKDMQILAFH